MTRKLNPEPTPGNERIKNEGLIPAYLTKLVDKTGRESIGYASLSLADAYGYIAALSTYQKEVTKEARIYRMLTEQYPLERITVFEKKKS